MLHKNDTSLSRLHAIDVFRAFTMFLMIFVNDLWSLKEIPEWLGHVPAAVDALGLADVVFPAFLFIVGLSIPYAIKNRINKGDGPSLLIRHIFSRSLALLIMGVFHVNLEAYNSELALLPKPLWQIGITIGFFMVWLDYSKHENPKAKIFWQGLGWLILILLALVYKGGSPENPIWMKFYWWGILGLIGWAYLIASLLFIGFKGKRVWMWLFFLGFIMFLSAEKLGWLEPIKFLKPYVWLIDDGSIPAFSLAGILVTVYFMKFYRNKEFGKFWIFIIVMSMGNLLFGLMSRPLWGIHKIGASPSWVTICIGLSIITFALLIWLVEIKDKKEAFVLIKPAGTSTLTCYLLPYIHYALLAIIGVTLPLMLRTGLLGIIKSLLYAIIIVLITGFLEKKKIRLKI